MASQRAYRFLESLQEQVCAGLGIPAIPFRPSRDIEQVARFVDGEARAQLGPGASPEVIAEYGDNYIAEVQQTLAEIPTKYQDPANYRILTNLMKELSGASEPLNIQPWPTPAVGTLRTGQVNAMTIAVPGENEFIIAFEEGLFTFALLLGKAVALAVPDPDEREDSAAFVFDKDEILRNIEHNPIATQRFREVVLAYAIAGTPLAAPPYFLDDRHRRDLLSILVHSLEMFVLGHEFGHILMGHLDSTRRAASALPTVGSDADELQYSHQEEYQADFLGLRLSLSAQLRNGTVAEIPQYYWGAEFFFHCMEVMDRTISILQSGTEDQIKLGSHPSNDERLDALRIVLPLEIKNTRITDPAIELGETLEFIVSVLWDNVRGDIARMHSEGIRPAKQWNTTQAD